MAFSPDGKTVAAGGRDRVVRLWDVESGKPLDELKGHPGTLRALTFSPDGKLLASGDLRLHFIIWDTASKKELQRIKVPATYTDRLALVFSPDSKTLACGGALNADYPRGIPSTDPMSFGLPDKGYPVLLWDAATGKEMGRIYGSNSRIRSLAFTPDGKTLAAASSDGRILLWDLATSKEKLCITAHPDNIDSSFRSSPGIAFGNDGQTLVSASTDRTIRLWDAVTGKEHGRLQTPAGLYALALSADGKTLISGGADTSVYVWDVLYLASARPQGKRNLSIGHIDLR